MDNKQWIERGAKVFMHNYAQFPLVLKAGDGCTLTDADGNTYLDMVAGIAVNSLGYGEPDLKAALHAVVDGGLLHCSNLYWNPYAIEAAELLVSLSGMERAFFCNSGTEANEAAIKLARKYGSSNDPLRTDIITMDHSFHGRTYAAMTATGQTKYQKSFVPLVPGFSYAPFNDIEGVKALVTKRTCAIMVEPIQGEGGVMPAKREFLKDLRALCDREGILLIFDEVQCGLGRTGDPFAYQTYAVKPDVVTLAKALAGGVPMGAVLACGKAADVFQPGDHAATFGGNLIASAAAVVMLKRLGQGDLTASVRSSANRLAQALQELRSQFTTIVDIRGIGLMMGVELSIPVRPIVEECMKRGLLIASSGTNVIRFVPPLTVTSSHIDAAVSILKDVLTTLS